MGKSTDEIILSLTSEYAIAEDTCRVEVNRSIDMLLGLGYLRIES